MKEFVRGARAAERLLRDPLTPVERLLVSEHLPALVEPDWSWLNGAPLSALPLPDRRKAGREDQPGARGSRRGPPGIDGVGDGVRRGRSRANEGRPEVPLGPDPTRTAPLSTDARTRSGALSDDVGGLRSGPEPSFSAGGLPERNKGLPPGGGTAGDGRSELDPNQSFSAGATISLRRIGERAYEVSAGPSADMPASETPGSARNAVPARPASAAEPSASRARGDQAAEPRTGDRGGGTASMALGPTLRSAMGRVADRTDAIAERMAGGQLAASRFPTRAPGDGAGDSRHPHPYRADPAEGVQSGNDGGLRPPSELGGNGKSFSRRAELPRGSDASDPTSAPDADWIIEVIGEALADQARREGVDLS